MAGLTRFRKAYKYGGISQASVISFKINRESKFWGSGYSIFSFMCMFYRSLFVFLYFFFWPLCFLFFFDIRILITPLVSLITPLVSSNSSYNSKRSFGSFGCLLTVITYGQKCCAFLERVDNGFNSLLLHDSYNNKIRLSGVQL